MPFITIPPSFYDPNNKSSLRDSRFVSQAISKLLKNKCIEKLDQKPYCCNPLTVAKSKKFRLVLDLRHVNSFIKQNKFRYENLTALSEILSEGDYFTTFDLSSAISDTNCETRTPSPLIQCWLQVCLLISGLGCLAWLLQAWYNIESGGRGDSGQL